MDDLEPMSLRLLISRLNLIANMNRDDPRHPPDDVVHHRRWMIRRSRRRPDKGSRAWLASAVLSPLELDAEGRQRLVHDETVACDLSTSVTA